MEVSDFPVQFYMHDVLTLSALHFQLSVAPQDESYEETEFGYKPLLHEQRDRELIELLPDYLTEPQGIYFPRAQAPKFYAKIVDNMSKHIILEED